MVNTTRGIVHILRNQPRRGGGGFRKTKLLRLCNFDTIAYMCKTDYGGGRGGGVKIVQKVITFN